MEAKYIEDLAERAKIAEDNHIWINAFNCINPTDEFKIQIANTILAWLDDKERVIAHEKILKQPILYLTINKS